MDTFDYTASAELYPPRSARRKAHVGYRRFDSAAEAVRFAVEELPTDVLRGSTLEVDDSRFEGAEIQALYDDAAYPFKRREAP